MKTSNISFCGFCDAFPDSYRNNFTYEGKQALFDYLEEYEDSTGDEIEMDIIAFCCEYSEIEDLKDFNKQYGKEFESIEEIREETQVIEIEGSERFIIQCY